MSKRKNSKNINTDKNAINIAYDADEGIILGNIEIKASIERAFKSLVSKDIIEWWIRPGVFDTKTWEGDVNVGGYWQSSGMFKGQSYDLKGKYLEINNPFKLVHTYGEGKPEGPTTVTYKLEILDNKTRIILRHEGFTLPDACKANALGWETCFQALIQKLEKNTAKI